MLTFDYLFRKITNEDGWLSVGTCEELSIYLKCTNYDIHNIYWLIRNGYSKKFIENVIFNITGKTIEELDNCTN